MGAIVPDVRAEVWESARAMPCVVTLTWVVIPGSTCIKNYIKVCDKKLADHRKCSSFFSHSPNTIQHEAYYFVAVIWTVFVYSEVLDKLLAEEATFMLYVCGEEKVYNYMCILYVCVRMIKSICRY